MKQTTKITVMVRICLLYVPRSGMQIAQYFSSTRNPKFANRGTGPSVTREFGPGAPNYLDTRGQVENCVR
jgi:hypothetical protein